MRKILMLLLLPVMLATCVAKYSPMASDTHWIHYNSATQTYSIDAAQIARGKLLDELKLLSSVTLQPQPELAAPVSAHGKGLTLDELIQQLLPSGAHYQLNIGEVDREIATRVPEKKGVAENRNKNLKAKRDVPPAQEVRSGTLKAVPESVFDSRTVQEGRKIKRPAMELVSISEKNVPRVPKQSAVVHNAVQLGVLFAQGAAPKLVSAQLVEGNASVQPIVVGSFLYVVIGPDSRLVHYGSFQDPLIQHSYHEDGKHDVSRARSGFTGILVPRDSLQVGRLLILDGGELNFPNELNDEFVSALLSRSKPLADVKMINALRMLDQGGKQ